MNKNLVRYKAITGFILFLVAIFMALLFYRVVNAEPTDYPPAPSDAGTLLLNGGNCSRRTMTWTHSGDYKLYILPITAPVCFSLNGTPFEHPYSLYSTEWNYVLQRWIETYDNRVAYQVSHCYEMPGGESWGGRRTIIQRVSSGVLYFKPVDNASPGWRCWRNWLPKVMK